MILAVLVIIGSVIKLCVIYQKTEGIIAGSIILSCAIIYFHIIDVFLHDYIMIKDIIIHFIPISIVGCLSLFLPFSGKTEKHGKKEFFVYLIPFLLFFVLKTDFKYYKILLTEILICIIVIIHLFDVFMKKVK